MANSTRVFTIKVNGIDTVINDVNELEDSIQTLEEELRTAQFGSDRFEELRAELVTARTNLEEFTASSQAISSGQIADGFLKVGEAAAGAVGLIGTALVSFGASAEDVENVQAKLQGLSTALSSVKAVTEALSAENRRSIKAALDAAKAYVQNGLAQARAALAARAVALATNNASIASTAAARGINLLQNALKTGPLLIIAGIIAAAAAAFAIMQRNAKAAAEELKAAKEAQAEGVNNLLDGVRKEIELESARSKDEIARAKARRASAEEIAGLEADAARQNDNIAKKAVQDARDRVNATNSIIAARVAERDELQKQLDDEKNLNNIGFDRRTTALRVAELQKEISLQTSLELELTRQIKDTETERLRLTTDVISAENTISEIQEQKRKDTQAAYEAEQNLIKAIRAQIEERLNLSRIGIGIELINSEISALEEGIKKVNETTESGLLEIGELESQLLEKRKELLDANAQIAIDSNKEQTDKLIEELDKRQLSEKNKNIELAKINEDSANNERAINIKLNDDKEKLNNEYADSVQGNADKIVEIRNEQKNKELELEKAKLEGVQAANDRIVDDEVRTGNERIAAAQRSGYAQVDIINKTTEQELLGIEKGSDEYLAIIQRRDDAIIAANEDTQEKIDGINQESAEKRKEQQMQIAQSTVDAIGSAVQIAQTIIDSFTQEVDARIEESKSRISDLQSLQNDLLGQQESLESELENARGQRAEDLLRQIDAVSAARSNAAKQEEIQNTILAQQEKEKAKLAQASAIASAIQTTAQAALATAIAFTPSPGDAAVPFGVGLAIRLAASLAFVASLVSSISAIKNAAKFEKGGLVEGKRHSEGGTLIEAEQGEFVVNRNAAAKHINVLRDINESGNRTLARKYENGGVVGISDSTFNALNSNSNSNVSQNIKSLNDRINQLAERPIFVAVKDINDGQGNFSKIRDSSKL